MSEKTFDSVEKMVDALSGGDSFADGVKQRIRANRVVTGLQAMRVAKGISQARIAQELGSTQSRVSKIETSEDSDLTLGEIEAYARAIDSDVHIGFSKRDITAVEKIKAHAFAIRRELDKLAECSQKDENIAEAVAAFFGEAFFNLVKGVQDASRKLPRRPKDGKPYIHISTELDERGEAQESAKETAEVARPAKRRRKQSPVLA
jgi:transcriptional regulator with XRE-family HTH domain